MYCQKSVVYVEMKTLRNYKGYKNWKENYVEFLYFNMYHQFDDIRLRVYYLEYYIFHLVIII